MLKKVTVFILSLFVMSMLSGCVKASLQLGDDPAPPRYDPYYYPPTSGYYP